MTGATSDPLIVALDLPSVGEAEAMVGRLGGAVTHYKIGLQLVLAGGLDLARELSAAGHDVFLDMKLLDIGATVGHAVESAQRLGVSMLTVHAYPQAMRAAVDAARGSELTLLGVSVLTSMDAGDLVEAGYPDMMPSELVERRARAARHAGMGGIVCSPAEASGVRRLVGSELAVVTPGVRPASAAMDDQKRIATPADAIAAGASHLVVGRPITRADDPQAAAQAIRDEIDAARRAAADQAASVR